MRSGRTQHRPLGRPGLERLTRSLDGYSVRLDVRTPQHVARMIIKTQPGLVQTERKRVAESWKWRMKQENALKQGIGGGCFPLANKEGATAWNNLDAKTMGGA